MARQHAKRIIVSTVSLNVLLEMLTRIISRIHSQLAKVTQYPILKDFSKGLLPTQCLVIHYTVL